MNASKYCTMSVAIVVDGTCYGLESGDRTIQLVVGACDGYPNANADTGFIAPMSLLIMEVIPQQLSQGIHKL